MNQRGAVVVLGLLVGGCSAPGALPESPEMVVVAEGLATTLEVEVGASEVHLILHVTNPTSRAIRLEFPTAQRYDFLVRSGDTEVWRWSADRMFTQAVGTETVAAGASLKYDAVWRPGTRSGQFIAVGRIMTGPTPYEKQAMFEVTGR